MIQQLYTRTTSGAARMENCRWRILLLCLISCFLSVSAFSIRSFCKTSWSVDSTTSLSMASPYTINVGAASPPPEPKQDTNRNGQRRKIRNMFMKAKNLERHGRWPEASALYRDILTLDPKDSHSHLALARLEARRNHGSKAQQAFFEGTTQCPISVHLWQAWALYEESCGHVERARELFQKALELDPYNPYVCHASGLMERKLGRANLAREIWERALLKTSTAALVCSLGELLIANRQYTEARELYTQHLLRLESGRERTEVYLTAAWLEEKYIRNVDRAEELIRLALMESPGESRAHVALARLQGRRGQSSKASARRLANACMMEHENATEPTDGRLYNAWAHLEVTSRRLPAARKILQKGMEKFPNDQSVSHPC